MRSRSTMPFSLHTEGFRDNPNRLAFLHGPLVLCTEVDTNQPVPAIVTEPGELLAALQPVPNKASTFVGSPRAFRLAGRDGRWWGQCDARAVLLDAR